MTVELLLLPYKIPAFLPTHDSKNPTWADLTQPLSEVSFSKLSSLKIVIIALA